MQVRLSTDVDGIRTTYALTGHWNDRPWNGYAAGTVKALSVSAGIGADGGYAVTVHLCEGVMPAKGLTADFADTLGAAEISV